MELTRRQVFRGFAAAATVATVASLPAPLRALGPIQVFSEAAWLRLVEYEVARRVPWADEVVASDWDCGNRIGVAARKGDWLHGVRCIFGDRTREAAKRFAEQAGEKLTNHFVASALRGKTATMMSQPVDRGIVVT